MYLMHMHGAINLRDLGGVIYTSIRMHGAISLRDLGGVIYTSTHMYAYGAISSWRCDLYFNTVTCMEQ